MYGLVADDVTGANATAARVAARTGLAARVELAGLSAGRPGPGAAPGLLRVIPTDSRALPPEEARRRVREAVAALRQAGCRRIGKRIDSTLRGNLGAELAGALEALPGHLAVVVAAYPASGRATSGGRLFVHGVPLAETEAARDPVTPVDDDRVAVLIGRQSGLPVAYLAPPPGGYDHRLVEELAARWRAGIRVVVLDAATEADIERIAALVARVPLPVLAVDPGPFFASWLACGLGGGPEGGANPGAAGTEAGPAAPAGGWPAPARVSSEGIPGRAGPAARGAGPAGPGGLRAGPTGVLPAGPWLVVAGSLSALTDRQLAEVAARLGAYRHRPALNALLTAPEREGERLLPGVRAGLATQGVAIVETDREARGTDPAQVAAGLGRLAARLVRGLPELAGVVLTGGDTAAAVARALGASGLVVTGELAPLVAAGRLEGGCRPGLAVITKGGLVGDEGLLAALLAPRARPAAQGPVRVP